MINNKIIEYLISAKVLVKINNKIKLKNNRTNKLIN